MYSYWLVVQFRVFREEEEFVYPPTFAEICASPNNGARFALDQKNYSCTLDNSTENHDILFY